MTIISSAPAYVNFSRFENTQSRPEHNSAASESLSTAERSRRTKRGVSDQRIIWPAGTMTVALDMKDKKSKAVVKHAIFQWMKETPSLKIKFVDGKAGHIRISDDEKIKGNWSSLGTNALLVPKGQPTMHLDQTNDMAQLYSAALHEFGHALGLQHEHQHPDRELDWDNEDIIKRSMARGYSRKDAADLIEGNIIPTASGPDAILTTYDPKSVMHYILAEKDDPRQSTVFRNSSVLSPGDKTMIRNLYKRNGRAHA